MGSSWKWTELKHHLVSAIILDREIIHRVLHMKLIPLFLASATMTLAATDAASAQESGTMPEFNGATWFNTPPLSTQDMEGRAVLVEVFRTW